ncbi:MAG: hypothetical protein IPH06_05115 [Alphaproteobacteria bacterium]|nr:hypothetical protein [Alphaproteobacteria bacterium]QQS57404.1 MAG: hypothetical protein IPN28_00875 [Alphaproteobacteria bacterium]
MTAYDFDLFIIGSGSGGGRAGPRAGSHARSVSRQAQKSRSWHHRARGALTATASARTRQRLE